MDNAKLYENFDWSQLNQKDLKLKIKKILYWIPNDVKTIIDVGCGNGAITNILNEHFELTAVDRSESSLKYVKSNKLVASAHKIPLPNTSFDMVFSSELLEHLDDNTFYGAINEFNRLSKKYIFITVPNGENPDKLSIKCPKCGCVFNRPNHLRSFNKKDFESLFPEFNIINSIEFGIKTRYYNPKLLKIKLNHTPSHSWVPYYWMSKKNRKAFCPKCENIFYYPFHFNVESFLIDVVNVLVSHRKPYWLFTLMERK